MNQIPVHTIHPTHTFSPIHQLKPPIRHQSRLIKPIEKLDRNLKKENKIHYENGQLYLQEFYQDNKLDGERKIWYKNGQLWIKSFYQDGKLEGESKSWNASGELKTRELYRNGTCTDRCLTASKNQAFLNLKRALYLKIFCSRCHPALDEFLISDLFPIISHF